MHVRTPGHRQPHKASQLCTPSQHASDVLQHSYAEAQPGPRGPPPPSPPTHRSHALPLSPAAQINTANSPDQRNRNTMTLSSVPIQSCHANVESYCPPFSPYLPPATRDRLLTTTQSLPYDTISDSGPRHIRNVAANLAPSTLALAMALVFFRISGDALGRVWLLRQL